ncbi:MAG TPA: protein-L-isoaspartate(D-aspartate) O-methyltransferase, partial [Solirubrobacteraceae bacterium]|nr:protein-L-isoaspartate(D-aspartate) O-methyltransferase [Solirubrobacteraceae bacterium]
MGAESMEALLAQLRGGVVDERVLAALAAVPRDRFVPPELQGRAWEDVALPIAGGQTISQPRVVAHMAELLQVRRGDRVLDIGTGSGYHAAVLAALGARVWSIERDPALSAGAARALAAAGVDENAVELLVGDGTLGHPAAAPYDGINVAAAASKRVPRALLDQLAPGGRMVLPVGERLVLVRRGADGQLHPPSVHGAVRFVPLIGG